MESLQPHLTALLDSLPPSLDDRQKLNELVALTLLKTRDKFSLENRKAAWEYLLKNDIFQLAETEGKALLEDEAEYYRKLQGKLDLVLAFTEQDACEGTFPFTILQDLLETQTISSCSHIFSWIESRADRLTEGMVPQKGKALILLRTLNDLLRRLSKMGSSTVFCGQILTFLSGVFPLGERSGVNLRGEYGPTWEGVQFPDKWSNNLKVDEVFQADVPADNRMQVDKKPYTELEKKAEFYNTFWSLQLQFSKPPTFSSKETFDQFKEAVVKVLPVIKEATTKERAMMGSRGGANGITLKRKREPEEESNSNEYFFAKFLTSPDLLELEIADTHFRRQFLFQLLILLNHLANFTKTTKAAWTTTRNRSLQMDFTLEDPEALWVQETIVKVMEELRQTTPNGRVFADTAMAIMEKEKNWVKWKNELCTPFDKEPWSQILDGEKVGLFEATKNIRTQMRDAPPDWQWSLGTESLTEIWEMGYTSLEDLQNPFQPGDVKDFVKKIKLEDSRIALKRQKLEKIAKARAAATATQALPSTVTPVIIVSGTQAESSALRPESMPSPLAAPVPTLGGATSPLHPSLPPKPGAASKNLQEPSKNAPTPTVLPLTSTPPGRISTPMPHPVPIPDDHEIAKYDENKQRWAWLSLRAARDQYLQHFGRIGTGDIQALAQEIEKGQNSKGEDGSSGLAIDDTVPGSPASSSQALENIAEATQKDNEGDIKMES